METTVDNQLSIIEKSLPVFQQAGSILKENQSKTQKALIVGNSILDQWTAAWAIGDKDERFKALLAADERSNKYLVNCSTALKTEKEARAVITQIMDEMKKMFTACENDIDKSKAGTVPSDVQKHRDVLATELAKEEKRKREEAERIAAKQREAVEITSKISVALNQHFQNYLLEQKQKLTNAFNNTTLLTITDFQIKMKGYQPEYKREHYIGFSFIPTDILSAIRYHTKEEAVSVFDTVKTDAKYNEFNTTYKAEMGSLAQELLDKLPSKRSELIEADERAKAAAKAAEEARIAEEARQREIASANAANRAKLEEQGRIAREQETARLQKLQQEQDTAAEEQRRREQAENERLQREAEDARIKAEQEAEMQKQSASTMIMFEQEAAMVTDAPAPDARQGYEITVTHPAGLVELFQYWFTNEGKNLPIDKSLNTKLDQMKAYVEKVSHKQGRPCIESKFLKFEQSFKAVNKKPGKA